MNSVSSVENDNRDGPISNDRVYLSDNLKKSYIMEWVSEKFCTFAMTKP